MHIYYKPQVYNFQIRFQACFVCKKCNTSMRFPSVRESHNLKRASNSPVEDGDWRGEGEDFHFDIKVEARVNLVGGD